MKPLIAKPANATQLVFNELCVKGGGPGGGPARGKVLELLRESGKSLNELAYKEAEEMFAAFPDANPWYVCFAIGLAWGHLARLELGFTEAVIAVLSSWNTTDLNKAANHHMERGRQPIIQSLTGARILFDKITLPKAIPTTLEGLGRAQERWLGAVLNPKERPPYIGAWNGTAMFMTALFANPKLAATQTANPPALPPGGPIHAGLNYLFQGKIVTKPAAGSELDDAAFEPGVIYEDNGLFSELCKQRSDWCMIDVHSGVYMLGTRDPRSATLFK
jgi:hypothetical protein